jgi:hypothetical protein
MTPADVAELVDAAPMPSGYELTVKPRRKFKYRSLWAVMVRRDDAIVWHRDYYNPALGIVIAQAVAWADSGAGA